MHGRAKAQAWLRAATEAVGLYGQDDAVPFAGLAADLATEIALLEALEAARTPHERRREQLYRQLDPTMLARTLPATATTGGSLAAAVIGHARCFPDADRFVSCTA
jgi:HAMP domain-containing protein